MAELDFSTIREFGQALSTHEEPKSQTKKAIVREVTPDGVVVEVGGSGVLTPVESSMATYSVGDVVQVTNRGGRLTIGGNATAPSVGAQYVNNTIAPVAQAAAKAAETAVNAAAQSESAQKVADEAQAVADATAQHFFSDTDGVHVTEAEQEEWTSSHTGKNILINSLGILLRNALNNLVSITASAIAFFDGSGNNAANVVAQFGASGAQIGKSGAAHSVIDANGQRFYAGDGTTQLANIGYGEGAAESGTATRPYYTFGVRTGGSIGNYSLVEGNMNTASGYSSHAEGYKTSAISTASHAQNYGTNAYMYAQTVIGSWNETESTLVTKSGTAQYSAVSEVDIYYAQDVTAVRVDGTELTRDVDYTVIGAGYISIYNNKPHVSVRFPPAGAVPVGSTWEIDYIEQKYIFVIGNGTSDVNRSNAFAVDWDGYIYPMAEKMPDWVVEQGTSGIWTYRKWHSGIAECWGTYSASIAITNSSGSYGGYRSGLITASAFPSGTFSATPTVTATSMSSGGNWVTNTSSSDKNNARFYLSCGTSSAASTRDIAIHAIGKWK